MKYKKNKKDIQTLSDMDCLLLTLMRMRHSFGLQDLPTRFLVSVESCGFIYNTWVQHMYFKFSQISIWPHRDVVLDHKPADFKRDLPTTLIILNCTELRTKAPMALSTQSQCYSDYKSTTTLKCLIGCGPRGSIMFVSELFTGSISDKAITTESGFLRCLVSLIDCRYVKKGDAVMCDKGFTISQELEELNIGLNIPPFASTGSQMSMAHNSLTKKIARHRMHVEREIRKVKNFKIVSEVIPTTLYSRLIRFGLSVVSLHCFRMYL